LSSLEVSHHEKAGDESQIVIDDRRRRQLILAAMCLALVAVIASVSGLNVAQQALAAELGATESQLLWIINGYTLVLAALLMPVGALGDRWGRRPVLLVGLVVFMAANMASAFARSPDQLIGLRGVAGLGAAMIMPVTLSIITTSFPPEERARAIGTWAGFAGGGGILGLFVSAAIIDNTGWQWVFAMPIALAASSFVVAAAVLPESREHDTVRFDALGSILSVLAIGGWVLALQEGPNEGWSASVTLVGLTIGIGGCALFAVVEMRTAHPLFDVRLFAIRGLAAGSVSLFVVFAVMFALFLVLIQFLQAVLGYSAIAAACGLLPLALILMPISTIAPRIAERVGFRTTVVVGMLLVAAGLAALALLTSSDRGYLSILPGLVVLAVGVGLSMSPSTAAIISSLPLAKQGVASALNDTVRELGGAVGIALIGSVLNAAYRSHIEHATASLPAPLADRASEGVGGALAAARQLGPDGAGLVNAARSAFVEGMRPALLLAAGVALAAAAFSAVRGPRRSRPESGATAAGAGAAAD
jgi:EmrB/QacA subfamily drug resistance transporter